MDNSAGFPPKKDLTMFGFFFLVWFCAIPVMAQTTSVKISQIRFYYDAVRFEEAIKTGREVLQKNSTLTVQQLSFAHRYMGLSFFNLGQQDSARSHFLSLLSLDPQAELDPVTTSPKIIDFFEETRSKQILPTLEKSIQFSRYLIEKDPRPSATWRSMVFPGWGQAYKAQKNRAWLIGGVFWSTTAATVLAYWQESRSHNRYLDSTDPQAIAANYQTYNNRYKTRRSLMVATVALWGLAAADALWYTGGIPKADISSNGQLQFGMFWRW